MTVLEVVVVLAIVVGLAALTTGAVRAVRRSTLVDSANELAALMRRASQLAGETGKLHRLVLDLDGQSFRVEACEGGPAALSKAPEPKAVDAEARKAAVEEARRRLASLPQGAIPASASDSAEASDDVALALANQLGARRTCQLADSYAGALDGRPLMGQLAGDRGVKLQKVWVQHLEDPVQAGLVAVHFFPLGSAEKAVVELADEDGPYQLLVHGLTGRIELRSDVLRDPEAFFLRDATGAKVEAP